MKSVSTALALLIAITWSSALAAQCRSNEVLVDEDKDNYYCKDRAEHAQCIRNTGLQLRQDRQACASRVQLVFTDARTGLSNAALSCVAGCLGNGLTVRGCLSSCGIGAVYPVQVLEKAVDETNSCLGQALIADKRRVEACKR